MQNTTSLYLNPIRALDFKDRARAAFGYGIIIRIGGSVNKNLILGSDHDVNQYLEDLFITFAAGGKSYTTSSC